jgi:hypothetical protein
MPGWRNRALGRGQPRQQRLADQKPAAVRVGVKAAGASCRFFISVVAVGLVNQCRDRCDKGDSLWRARFQNRESLTPFAIEIKQHSASGIGFGQRFAE